MSTLVTHWKWYALCSWLLVAFGLYGFLNDYDIIVLACVLINSVIVVKRTQQANLHWKRVGDIHRIDLLSVLLGVIVGIIAGIFLFIEVFELVN